jgi:hypothetical protein
MTYTNQTFFNLADQILYANYPGENITFPVLGNDIMSRFFVSPIMELIVRHVFFLFATAYVKNQASFYSNVSVISYYMIPEWIENRFLYRSWNRYNTHYFNDILFVNYTEVKDGEKWGTLIIDNYDTKNFHGEKDKIFPYVTNATWIDWKIRNAGPEYLDHNDSDSSQIKENNENSYDNKKPTLVPRSTGLTRYHKWIEDIVKEEYRRAVMATIAF